MKISQFDYESKVWGNTVVRISPQYLGALRLKYCLIALEDVTGSVLEVGCGAGGMSKGLKFYRSDLDVHGVDISQKTIALAKKDAQGVKFSVGDAYSLPFEDHSFAAVIMFDVLEHVKYPKRVLKEVKRIVQSDGVFYAFIPCEGEPFTLHALLSRLGWRPKEIYAGHIQEFTIKELEDIYRDAGFVVINKKWIGHLINQLFDVGYFTFLALRGRNVAFSVEGYISQERRGSFLVRSITFIKNLLSIISYIESYAFSNVKGFGVSITVRKYEK